ncbi:MAG: flagellar hook-length control protein FliK [Bradyrhizobium sp.]|jgi:flagellar hook-length control protein FliK
MVAPIDILGSRSLVPLESLYPTAAIGDVREEDSDRLSQLAVGQKFKGTVQTLLDDGSFIIKLADTAVRTNLPQGSKVGDQLQLTLVGTQPRATFLLEGEPSAAPATFSPTARLIDSLQQHATSTALLGKTPLVSTGATPPAQLATALQSALTGSGIFYESHVQQWANGERPLADVLREPQNVNARSAVPAAAATAAAATTAAVAMTAAAAAAPDAVLNPDTARIVNLQLNTLDIPRVQWQGEVWPGQQMQWEVSEQPQQPKGEAETPERSWQSVVRFDLPTLGRIAATITLVGDHVQVQMRTANPDSAQTLRLHGAQLSEALAAAGSTLDLLTVKQDEQNEQA